MGSRADFYLGRGKDAEWLGSIAWDGYPSGIPDAIKSAVVDAGFRRAVEHFLSERDDATQPEQGWPWPWDNSQMTDMAYAFDEGIVWASSFGGGWKVVSQWPEDGEWEEGEESDEIKVEFPDMSERKNVTHGRRSGLLIFGVRR